MTRKALRQSGRDPEDFISVDDYQRWQSRLTWTVGFGTAAGVPLTFSGLYWVTDSILNSGLFTAVAAAVSFIVSAWLLDHFPRAPRRDRGKIFLIVVVPGLGVVLLTSTTWAGLTVAAPLAMQRDMQAQVELAEQDLARISELRTAEAAVIPSLEAQARGFELLYEGEILDGRVSEIRSDEPGKTAQDLKAIADSYRMAAKMVTDDQVRLTEARKLAETAIDEMRELADESDANRDGIRTALGQFAGQRRALGLAMDELGHSILDDASILGPLDTAISQQAATSASATSDKRRELQLKAKQTVAGLAAEARKKAEDTLVAARSELPETGDYRVAGPIEAIGRHLGEVAYTMAPPLAADLMLPLLCLFALSYSRSRLEAVSDSDDDDYWPTAELPSNPKEHHASPKEHHAPQSPPVSRLAKLEAARNNANLRRH